MAQYPHPQLGQGGQSHAPASKRHLIKIQNYQRYAQNKKLFFICLSNKYGASMRNRWPIIITHSPTLVLPYLSWFKWGIHAPATQTNRDTLKAAEFFFFVLSFKYRATMMN